MKKLLTLALAATLGVASFANASNEGIEELSSVRSIDKKVAISLKEGLGKVKLAVHDSEGKKLHQQYVKVKKDMQIPYDFSLLPAGEYQIMIESNIKEPSAEKMIYSVETKEAPAPLPLMAYGNSIDEKSFRLAVIGLEKPGTKVEILDQKGKAIFSEKIDQPEAFSKIYHLKNLTTKDVSLKVTDAAGRTKTLYL
jgi:carotenoid cleavage dioxygenase-like enzyme